MFSLIGAAAWTGGQQTQPVGGVVTYVHRPRWRDSGRTTSTALSIGMGGYVQKKMDITLSSAWRDTKNETS